MATKREMVQSSEGTTVSRAGSTKQPVVIQLPAVVRALWRAQQNVRKAYASTGLRFTLDGRLVGDIAEAVALDVFDLKPCPKRTGGVDALTRTGATVQVKATGLPRQGPAFTEGVGRATHFLFLALDFERCEARVVYNGLEAPVRKLLPGTWKGTKRVHREKLEVLAEQAKREHRLPMRPSTSKHLSRS
jgi:hypothetical protein